jgi:hypothetical protein
MSKTPHKNSWSWRWLGFSTLPGAIFYYHVINKSEQNNGITIVYDMPSWSDNSLARRGINDRWSFFAWRAATDRDKMMMQNSSRLMTWKYAENEIDQLLEDEGELNLSEKVMQNLRFNLCEIMADSH